MLKEQPPLKICLATSELAPLAKVGGLAEVSAALAGFLDRNGHDLRVLMPLYSAIDTTALDIEPVDGMQHAMRFGTRDVHYSLDTTVLPGSGVRIHLLRCPEFYDRDAIYTADADEPLRFILLSRAAIEMCRQTGFAPDIFHCHDWHTALIPLYLKTRYARDRVFSAARSVLTVHNIGYQGVFDSSILGDLGLDGAEHKLHGDDLAHGHINFLKTGLLHADFLTTVSPTHAKEIQGDEYGMGLQDILRVRSHDLVGILNGVDYEEWNPETDRFIPKNYSRKNLDGKAECKRALLAELNLDSDVSQPLLGMVTRLTPQKGIDLIQSAIPALLQDGLFSFVVLGSGEPRYEAFFDWLRRSFHGRVAFHRGFHSKLAHRIEAGSDMFLMPSHYEPCGLNQMYSLRYGTVPIVRETGGLADSVQMYDPETCTGNGILFRDYDEPGLRWAISTALDFFEDRPLWRRIQKNGMAADYSWETSGQQYVDLFRHLAA